MEKPSFGGFESAKKAVMAGALVAGVGFSAVALAENGSNSHPETSDIEDEYATDQFALGFNTLYKIVGHKEYDGETFALLEFHGGLKMRTSIPALIEAEEGTQFMLVNKGENAQFEDSLIFLDMTAAPQKIEPGQ